MHFTSTQNHFTLLPTNRQHFAVYVMVKGVTKTEGQSESTNLRLLLPQVRLIPNNFVCYENYKVQKIYPRLLRSDVPARSRTCTITNERCLIILLRTFHQ